RESGHATVDVEGDARTVEDKTIVSADLIHVNDGEFMVAGESLEHVDALAAFVQIVGRRGNIKQDASSLPDEFGDRIAIVHALRPEIFVVPTIFANGDSQLLAVKSEIRLRARGLKITRLVENIVGGKKHFLLLEGDVTVGEKRGAIRGEFSGRFLRFADVADDCGHGHAGGEALKLFEIALDEGGTFDEILRRIAAQAEFGKNDEVGGAGFRFAGHLQHAGGISREIADGWIELGQSYLHGERSAYEGG